MCERCPFAEQHRIVAKVDELMALGDKLKAGIQASRVLQAQVSSVMLQGTVSRESEKLTFSTNLQEMPKV